MTIVLIVSAIDRVRFSCQTADPCASISQLHDPSLSLNVHKERSSVPDKHRCCGSHDQTINSKVRLIHMGKCLMIQKVVPTSRIACHSVRDPIVVLFSSRLQTASGLSWTIFLLRGFKEFVTMCARKQRFVGQLSFS